MKKKFIFLLIIIGMVSITLGQTDPILQLLESRRWSELSPYFADKSFQRLGDYFRLAKMLHFERVGELEFTYKVKFDRYGEMGFVIFEKEGTRLHKTSITNQIKPLVFIEKIRKYTINNHRFKIGEADIQLRSGNLYQILPFYHSGIFFFEGAWDISITPSDSEERFTLLRHFKSDTFIKLNTSGFFILPDDSLIAGMTPIEELSTLPSSQLLNSLIGFYLDYFGLPMEEFNETWFLSILEKESLIAFEKDRKSFYVFDYNPDASPDTQLRTTDENKLFLNYNAEKMPRLLLGKNEEIQEVKMNLYYNPEKSFLSGTATLTLPTKMNFVKLNLNANLNIRSATTAEYKTVSFFRKADSYYVNFPESEKLTFYFNGTVASDENIPDLVKIVTDRTVEKRVDEHYLLSRNLHFFPNTGIHFLKSSLKISLPDNLNCIASGKKESSQPQLSRNTFHFTSPGTKGVSLISGDFKEQFTIDSEIPLRVFHTSDLRIRNYFNIDEIKKGANFLYSLYGPLDLPEVNVIFRRWMDDGGISNSGFIIMNIIELNQDVRLTNRFFLRDSPVILTQEMRDFFIHELAHQWWGGKVSWSGYRDEWITEGMAHYSVLAYLQENISEKSFQGIIERMKRLIFKHQEAGPVIYGRRIANLEPYDAFQTIIYNKAALIIMMLREILGADEFYARLRTLLTEFRFKSITTSQWIRHMGKNHPLAERFLNRWLTVRKIPEMTYSYSQSGDTLQIHFHQTDSDFIFPIWIEIESENGIIDQSVLVDQTEVTIPVKLTGQLKSLRINSGCAPVQVKREY